MFVYVEGVGCVGLVFRVNVFLGFYMDWYEFFLVKIIGIKYFFVYQIDQIIGSICFYFMKLFSYFFCLEGKQGMMVRWYYERMKVY